MNNNEYTITLPSIEQIKTEIENIPTLEQPVITKQEEAQKIGEYLVYIATCRKKIEATFKPVLDAIKQSSKQAKALQDKLLQPLEEKEKLARNALSQWETQLWQMKQKELNSRKKTTAIVPADNNNIENISYRTEWIPVITDLKMFLTNIVRGNIPENCISVDMGVLKKLGTQSKGTLHFPGVKWETKRVPIVKTSTETEE